MLCIISIGYGLTETHAGGCCIQHWDTSTPTGSVGVLFPNTKAKVNSYFSKYKYNNDTQSLIGKDFFNCEDFMKDTSALLAE